MQSKVYRGKQEDGFTGALEAQTSKMPSSGYLAFAAGIDGHVGDLKRCRQNDWALFVGQWAAPFLIIGVYNKMVKQHGSDAYSSAA